MHRSNEWESYLTEDLELAIRPASQEFLNGKLSRGKLAARLNREEILLIAKDLISLIYDNSVLELENKLDEYLIKLPGGEEWNTDN